VPSIYDSGFLATAALVALLAAQGTYLIVRDWVVAALGGELELGSVGAALRPATLATGAAVGIATAGVVASHVERTHAADLSNQLESSLLLDPPRLATLSGSWNAKSVARWTNPGQAHLSLLPGGTLYLTSSPSGGSTELLSPPMRLGPGSYALVVDGTVAGGGLQLSAIDPGNGSSLGLSRYWSKQVGFDSKRMVAQFTLEKPMTVQVALGAWGDQAVAPEWTIRSVELGRLPA
jgi:hypothetical protein